MFQIVCSNEDGSFRLPEKYPTREAAEVEAKRLKLEADQRVRAYGGEWFESNFYRVDELNQGSK